MTRAIHFRVIDRIKRGEIYIDEKEAPYGKYQVEGTNSPIRPKRAKYLSFFSDRYGKWFNKLKVKGIPKDEFVEATAQSFGVPASSIATPTPFMVSQLALYWAYMTAAWRKASLSIGKSADNDAFALKYRIMKELLDDLLDRLTADSFTNGQSAKKRVFPCTMAISRN